MVIAKAASSDMPALLNKVHISTAEKPKTDPMERSNSPAVISSVMARAISPSSTVNAMMLLRLLSDRKAGLMALKMTNSATRRISGPISGRRMRR